MSNRLGFMSGAGIVLAAVSLAVLLAWTLAMGPALFSPGPLNASAKTQTLGGVARHSQITDCSACHSAPWNSQTMADKCLGCHTDISTQIQAKSGLHDQLLGHEPVVTCRGCHTEHHGAKGPLTDVDEATFPHELMGYSLRGHRRLNSGRRFTCVDCHPAGLATFDPAPCSACHTGIDAVFMAKHDAEFGKDCLSCHDGTARSGANFDHNNTQFKLVGAHIGLACDRCHTGGSMPSQECGSCHAKNDKHQGAFGLQCGQCHAADTWANAKFDHTAFPINHGGEGGQPATCQTCHPNGTSTYTCYGCHEHTLANVQANHRGRIILNITNCIPCHKGGGGGG